MLPDRAGQQDCTAGAEGRPNSPEIEISPARLGRNEPEGAAGARRELDRAATVFDSLGDTGRGGRGRRTWFTSGCQAREVNWTDRRREIAPSFPTAGSLPPCVQGARCSRCLVPAVLAPGCASYACVG